ncbi:glycosyltransferase family 4 protein [uncultured Tenacibaculum sp.]|uniref:glycosyltransferase family 4 protein n=1 Tax=uncultured Tenacibaculum sp. TaxID=174713 RepID=UPI002629F384|nr:glycosyltransferase family 4 protein [uncultured Tenacibaculum sp.]
MKILYIHQYFRTPLEPGGTRSYWIAQELIKEGHSVTMLTTSSTIKNKIERKIIDGINVIYLRVPYNQKMSIFQRLISFFSFMIKSSYYSLREKKVDLVVATSTPLTIGFPALVLKKIKRVPYLFEVRDLWPEVPIQMGALKNNLVRNLAIWFEKTIYKNAKHIIALSPGMEKGVLKYEKQEKVSMIPNMAKIDAFYPRSKNIELVEKLGLKKDSFKLIHFGALGIANGIDTIIESATLLKDDDSIEFIFIGGGSTEEAMKNKCKNNNLNNVHFLGRYAMQETSEIVNLCDVSLVSFLDLPILYTNSPNKLFDSLSAGKPLIVNSAGWTKDLVEKYKCGYYSNPKEPSELVTIIKELQNEPEKMKLMGENSRKLAENEYDKSILCAKFVNVISKIS